MKRSAPGSWFVVLSALVVASSAFAKDNGKPKKDTGPDHNAGLMEAGEKDPAETETLDEDGQFVPGKKKQATTTDGQEATTDADANANGTEGKDKPVKKSEPDEPARPVKVRKTVGVFAEALFGFGSASVPGPASPITGDTTTGSATSYGFLIGGHYDVTPAFRALLRIPWTVGTIKGANGQDASANALGVPELAGRYRLTDPGNTEWAVRLAIGIPVAQGSPDFTDTEAANAWAQGRLQTVADAANGWHDPELYAVKRLPITPALLFTHRVDKLRLNAELKAAVMPKIGGSIRTPDPGGGTLSLNAVAFTALLGGTASYEVIDHLHLALAAWLAYVAAPSVDYSSSAVSPTPFQFVLEPRLFAQFGKVVPSAGFLIPLGGQLGGNIYGVRIHVDVGF